MSAVAVRAWMMSRFLYGFGARAARGSSTSASPTIEDRSTAAKAVGEMQSASRRPGISGVGAVGSTTRLAMWITALASVHRPCR